MTRSDDPLGGAGWRERSEREEPARRRFGRMPGDASPPRRRNREVVRRIDPWSVLRVSVLLYVALYGVVIVAGVILWTAFTATGVRGNVEEFIADIIESGQFKFVAGELFRASLVVGAILVIMGTAANTIFAVLYNLISDLVGGVTVVVEDRPSRRAERAETRDAAETPEPVPSAPTRKRPLVPAAASAGTAAAPGAASAAAVIGSITPRPTAPSAPRHVTPARPAADESSDRPSQRQVAASPAPTPGAAPDEAVPEPAAPGAKAADEAVSEPAAPASFPLRLPAPTASLPSAPPANRPPPPSFAVPAASHRLEPSLPAQPTASAERPVTSAPDVVPAEQREGPLASPPPAQSAASAPPAGANHGDPATQADPGVPATQADPIPPPVAAAPSPFQRPTDTAPPESPEGSPPLAAGHAAQDEEPSPAAAPAANPSDFWTEAAPLPLAADRHGSGPNEVAGRPNEVAGRPNALPGLRGPNALTGPPRLRPGKLMGIEPDEPLEPPPAPPEPVIAPDAPPPLTDTAATAANGDRDPVPTPSDNGSSAIADERPTSATDDAPPADPGPDPEHRPAPAGLGGPPPD